MTTPDPYAAPPRQSAPWDGPPANGVPPQEGRGSYGPPPPHAYGPPPAPGAVPMAYGYPLAPQTDGTAIVVLVLAITSFVAMPVIPAIIALVLAPSAERDIAASGGRLTGQTLVRAGRIVAWVHLGLCLAFLVVVLAVFGTFGAVVFND